MTFRLIQCYLSCLLILAATTSTAREIEANEIDIDNAPTPLKMSGLLPEGGIDELEYDFYLVARVGKGPNAFWGGRYMRFTAKKIDGKIVLTRIFGINKAQWVKTTRLTFNAKGEFEEYKYSQGAPKIGLGADLIEQYDGVPYLGYIYAKRTQVTREAFGPRKGEVKTQFNSTRLTLPEASGAVSGTLIPAIFAYHIRQNHLGYSFAVTESVATSRQSEFLDPPVQCKVEDVGTEQVEFDGQERTARVLLISPTNANGSPAAVIRVFENGEIFSVDSTRAFSYYGPFETAYQRVTPAQFEEILGLKLDENGDPPLSWQD